MPHCAGIRAGFAVDPGSVCLCQPFSRPSLRFPFDDEIYTLALIERPARALLTILPATQDDHPPLSYLVFHGLRQLGLTDAGMRLCSLAMTALALLLVQILVLTGLPNATVESFPRRHG